MKEKERLKQERLKQERLQERGQIQSSKKQRGNKRPKKLVTLESESTEEAELTESSSGGQTLGKCMHVQAKQTSARPKRTVSTRQSTKRQVRRQLVESESDSATQAVSTRQSTRRQMQRQHTESESESATQAVSTRQSTRRQVPPKSQRKRKRKRDRLVLYIARLLRTKEQSLSGYSVAVAISIFMSIVLVLGKHLRMTIFALSVSNFHVYLPLSMYC